METVFIKILNMSISASWLVFAIIILRAILRNAPKWIRCIMWGLVGVRLLCPFSLESMLSLIPSAEVIPQDIMYAEAPVIQSGVTAVNRLVNPVISNSLTPTVGDSVNPMQIVMFLAAAAWVLGMIILLVYAAISYLRIQRKVAASMRAENHIYVCDYIDTPFILGVFKPRIYIPSSIMEDEKIEYVIAHEKAHLKRHDHWWKPLGFLLLTVYWFNPVIWIAYVLLCRDIELACDEYVISRLEESDKKLYSHALLSCSIPRRMIAACPLAFGEVGVTDRVKAILNYKKPAFWIIAVSVIACIGIAVCFMTNPKEKPLHAPEPFGHTYRVEEILYDDLRYSFAYTIDTAPRYQFTSDYAMFVSGDVLDETESLDWVQQHGKFEEVKLSQSNFDDYFVVGIDGPTSVLGADIIRKNAEKVWRIDIMDEENGVFYYFILSKHGEIYLTYGYDTGDDHTAEENGDLIRWVFKLARTDILTCNAVSEDSNAFIEPVYYPEGFDWDYDELTEGVINERGKLIFSADWDVESLTVSEDYYNNYGSGNKNDITTIEKETYTLQRNAEGNFELDVAIRSQNGDMAVYFIQGPEGVYVMKIIFADDEASLMMSSQQYQPEEFLGMSYGDFQKLTETEAEFYHANFYTATIPNTEITAVFMAEGWDEEAAISVLQAEDRMIRLEGKVSALMDYFTDEKSIAAFREESKWKEGLLKYTIEEGAGTAYYVADNYAEITYDMDGDSMADWILQVALDQNGDVTSDAECWITSAVLEKDENVTVTHYPAHKVLYEPTASEDVDSKYDNEEFVITELHYENLDGEWVCGEYTYKYRLEITGRMPNAAKSTTYIVLSNTEDITFDQTWKASGFSSNLADYFEPSVAVIVGHKLFS